VRKISPAPAFDPRTVQPVAQLSQQKHQNSPPPQTQKSLNTFLCCILTNPFHIVWTSSHSHALTWIHSYVHVDEQTLPKTLQNYESHYHFTCNTCPFCHLTPTPAFSLRVSKRHEASYRTIIQRQILHLWL